MNIEKETLLRLSECEHLMRTNVEIENYEIDILWCIFYHNLNSNYIKMTN